MKLLWILLLVVVTAGTAFAQTMPRAISAGYLCPAGAAQGTTVEVMVGGQSLAGVHSAYISGPGVTARVLQYLRPLNRDQQRELARRLQQLVRQQQPSQARLGAARTRMPRRAANRTLSPQEQAAQSPDQAQPDQPANQPSPAAPPAALKGKPPKAAANQPVTLPDHPLLRNLEQKTPGELRDIADRLLRPPSKQQIPAAIAETVVLEVTVAPDAPPGERELRLQTPRGLTNPLPFMVGTSREIVEHEPNNPDTAEPLTPLELPVVLNGQILPGDVDRFPLHARRGQKLVITAQARQLVPYLADAVPGWFQAVLTLYDAQGQAVAFSDDYRFHPDPVVLYEVPQDGEYTLEIRDAIYRGREDFVYRITVGEQPFITSLFPLGARAGTSAVAAVSGWNLPGAQVAFDTTPGNRVREAAWRWHEGGELTNRVHYAVDDLPECIEAEPKDAPGKAHRVELPIIINGRIGKPGDVDIFEFAGRAGDQIVAEICARRLDSPLDSLLRLTDEAGSLVALNDDCDFKEFGLLTHQADSCLTARLPRDGVYRVQVSDASGHGGQEYAYRLRLSPPRPDFVLVATPASLLVGGGRCALLQVQAFRREGFTGEIEVVIREPASGFLLSGGRIPQGRDSVQMTLAATGRLAPGPVVLQLEGRARVGNEILTRPVLPAHSMMQAFAYWHLVPAQMLLVAVAGGAGRAVRPPVLDAEGPIRVPAGGSAQVRFLIPPLPAQAQVTLELHEPAPGLSLGQVKLEPGLATLELKADGKQAPAGYADNVLVQAFSTLPARPDGQQPSRRISLGFLPAIPIEVVAP